MTVHADAQHLWTLIAEISKEFETVQKQCHAIGKPFVLGEIFCSSQSPLTHQVHQLEGQAFRHGEDQGDLATTNGRQKLFQKICMHRPKHLWFSPTCGPWSSWSSLNASRSIGHMEEYHQKRHDLRYQLALGVVLYRYQILHGRHFHWEQPQRSLMFLHSGLNEIHEHTRSCMFDMCEAGNLRDPKSGDYMKKGMHILTTNEDVFKHLHGRTCRGDHVHQHLEGTICHNGHTIHRTAFSEVYPRKFARSVAKVLISTKHSWPFNWQSRRLLHGLANPEPVLVNQQVRSHQFAKTRNRPVFPRSQLGAPISEMPESSKRRRLDGKQCPIPSLGDCQEVLQEIQPMVPRVGKVTIQNSQIINKLQGMFPDKQIMSIVACRGTDRTLSLPKDSDKSSAPYRKALMILRSSNNVMFERHWEQWSELSNRQMIRPAHSCRLNVTMFAKEIEKSVPGTLPLSTAATIPEPLQGSPEPTPAEQEQPRTNQPETFDSENEVNSDPRTTTPVAETTEAVRTASTQPLETPESSQELNRNHQGDAFKSLPPWEQTQLIRIHKNLGHPTNEKLANALKLQGQRPEVIRAALELRCTVCSACAAPKHQRPGSLKNLLDFNHRVYMDGIKWTNKSGQSFQFYHVLDAGTHFHVAFVAPSHTSSDIIRLFSQHWMNWAGAPQELKVDSGTELNSQEFAEFNQRFGIRCETTCPEAHWQNGKIERHGDFLQHMLTKIDLELSIQNYADMQMALNQCTQAKNSLSSHQGYSPELIVFGKQSRLPGSVLNDDGIPSHASAVQEEQEMSSSNFKQMLKLREIARQAFHTADNSSSLRRAMLRRSCPSRGQFAPGQWVMIWRTQGPNRKGWIGPQRTIIQESNHTVWTSQSGRLFRSAPENVRLALPEEGHPESSELPEDLTMLQNQIRRMTQNPNSLPPIDEEVPSNDLNVENFQNPDNRRDSQSSESIGQPDQEPDLSSRQLSPVENLQEASGPEEEQDAFLTSSDEPDVLTTDPLDNFAWRCEYEMTIPECHLNRPPSQREAWALLVTNAKKQRTEVKLSELSASERSEFEAAKQAEVSNWINTDTISKILRHQVPTDQILRCRWILTWKPLDQTSMDVSNGPQRTHKAKARIVVLGYMDPNIENIPRDSPTMSKTSRMMLLQILATHRWAMESFDIKAAFLQGQPQAGRLIAVDPVPELR